MRINSVPASGVIPSDLQNAKDVVVNAVTLSLVLHGYGTPCHAFSEEHESHVLKGKC